MKKLDVAVSISPEADRALREADIIIYGPGTQFSSLLPSYRTTGLDLALRASRAVKIFVGNIAEDNDIQGLSCSDIVDKALFMMSDAENTQLLITHIFCNEAAAVKAGNDAGGIEESTGLKTLPLGNLNADKYKNAAVSRCHFESGAHPGTHSGYAVVRRAIDIFESTQKRGQLRSLEIYVDLQDRSHAVDNLLEEFLDLPWTEQFESVQLRLNRASEVKIEMPKYASLARDDYRGLFTEVEALLNWLTHSETDYLVTLTGDGEYRLRDILNAVQILRMSPFGAVYGSRTQSRHQFRTALDSAYGENSLLRFISFCGAFFFTAIFGLFWRVIFSDPFTGFRVYRRSKFTDKFIADLKRIGSVPAGTVTRLMLHNRIEIAVRFL